MPPGMWGSSAMNNSIRERLDTAFQVINASIVEVDTPAFVTGSRAYGTPRPDSDVDIVVMMTETDLHLLRSLSDSSESINDPCSDGDNLEMSQGSFKFGKMNIIAVTKPHDYLAWKQGTDDLKKLAPVHRDYAIEHLRKMKMKALTGQL
jgi:predicted nucleotidyltransferase